MTDTKYREEALPLISMDPNNNSIINILLVSNQSFFNRVYPK